MEREYSGKRRKKNVGTIKPRAILASGVDVDVDLTDVLTVGAARSLIAEAFEVVVGLVQLVDVATHANMADDALMLSLIHI